MISVISKVDRIARNMRFHTYYLYGLNLRSRWVLPCPEEKSPGLPEVTLCEGSSTILERCSKDRERSKGNAFLHYANLQDGTICVRWSGLFEFVISSDGASIMGRSLNHATTESFLTYLLGQTLSFALVKQGIEPIHSTVVGVHDGAVGFIGDCGYGKSSLAASFLKTGHPLLTDDLLVLKQNNDGFMAYPGFPRIKLFPRMARKLIGENVGGVPMNHLTSKLILPLDRSQFARSPVPLRSIYVLTPPAPGARSQKVTIRKLSQRGAFLALLRNTFNAKVTEPDRLKRQFLFFTQVVSKVPVKSLSYPRVLKLLPKVHDAILNDLASA